MALKNKKSLGQNWLKNREILNEIADLAATDPIFDNPDATPAELEAAEAHALETAKLPFCLEIGPGLGTLTSSLLKRFEKVLAVEFDADLAKNLPKSFPGTGLQVINADFLKCDLSDLPKNYIVAANIPYYITSPIIEKLLTEPNLPSRIVILIQKEVAERIAAAPGRLTNLALFVQNRARVTLGPIVPRTEFTPAPKVDSQVIILDPKTPAVPEKTFKLIKQGMSSPRKKLLKNLSAFHDPETLHAAFATLNLNPDARPADLSLADWAALDAQLETKN